MKHTVSVPFSLTQITVAAVFAVTLLVGSLTANAQFDDKSANPNGVYTDLGNLEHGLHGLNWAPDGKLYMSKRNSKGLNQPGRYAPKAFRDLWGLTTLALPPKSTGFGVEEKADRLHISLDGKPIADFVFRDDKILRPYFANARLPGDGRLPDGLQVTRNHPPVNGVDAVDHDTMHPGIWLGFGDISGQDFWRNKASMEHIRFVVPPTTVEGRLRYVTECRLKTDTGEPLCRLTNHFTLAARPNGWLLVWDAEFHADQRDIAFGDQEEMGFGARVATAFTEKNGGSLRSSTGQKTAKATWGQPAAWCDYAGTSGDSSGGIMLMASPDNFRESWWHNRDYGVFVANPFGREAMKQGTRSSVKVTKGETLRVTFGALVHDHREINGTAEFEAFRDLLKVAAGSQSDVGKAQD